MKKNSINKKVIEKELNKFDNIEFMLLDGINVMHELLDTNTRNKLDFEEMKAIVAINNSLNASIKTYLQTEIVKKRLAETSNKVIGID